MKLASKIIAPALLGVIMTLTAPAARTQDMLLMRDGSTRRVIVVLDDGRTLTVKKAADAPAESIDYAALDARTIYRLRAGRTKAADGGGQIEIAAFALENGLLAHARRHADLARRADPMLEIRAREILVRAAEMTADRLLAMAEDKLLAGDHARARSLAEMILGEYPESAAARRAQMIVEETADALAKRAATEETAMLAKMSAADREALSKTLREIDDLTDAARRGERDGLSNTKKLRAATEAYEGAVEKNRRALKRIAEALRVHQDHDAEKAVLRAREQDIRRHIIALYLDLASLNAGRQSYAEALKNVDRALAEDPAHAEAKSARARIELEQAYSSASKYRRGR